MFAAAHLDNWLFLVFVGVALFFQLVSRLANTGKRSQGDDYDEEKRSTPPPVVTRRNPIHDSDSDQIRKFLEALGQPPSSPPPPPVAPRTNVPPRPVAPVQPPRVLPAQVLARTIRKPESETGTGEWPRKEQQAQTVTGAGKTYVPRVSTKPTSPPPLPSDISIAGQQVATAPATTRPDIAELLRSPDSLRNAIILREIFGPPRSLQPIDSVS